jgi:hypothetical protein
MSTTIGNATGIRPGARRLGRRICLGGAHEFRLFLAAAYAFDNGSRLGIGFGRISNADIHLRNPGENDLMIT